MKPSIGRIVIYRGIDSNGSLEHPAIITRVWSDTCVNLTVFPDNGEVIVKTSVNLDQDKIQSHGWAWPFIVK